MIELNEDTSKLNTTIYSHPWGEIWKLNSSPHDVSILSSCYNTQKGAQVIMQTALLKLSSHHNQSDNQHDFLSFESSEIIETEEYGKEIKTTEFHPTDPNLLGTVIDNRILIYNRGEAKTRIAGEINLKNSPKFSNGKWSQHHQGNQFVALYESSIRSYDIRDTNHCAWIIEDAHSQTIRDLDCNPNKQCHIATGGDDGCLKIWDCRNIKEPVFTRTDHSHWIWSVRFNTFHDQLVLTSSSDCKVMLTCAGSVSSDVGGEDEDIKKERLNDGLLQTFEQHEDSVYCVEWSSADPWIFASLSYDGRMILTRVPKQYKYQFLM